MNYVVQHPNKCSNKRELESEEAGSVREKDSEKEKEKVRGNVMSKHLYNSIKWQTNGTVS